MQKFEQIKKKSSLLLIAGILILSAGFLILGCGSESPFKVSDPFSGAYALDNTDCPVAGACSTAFTSQAFNQSHRDISGKEITIEGWVNPITNSSSPVFQRKDSSRGVMLSVAASSTPTVVTPTFTIMRALVPTGTISYTVTGTVELVLNTWAHIAGILVNDDHTNATGDGITHVACAGAESETPHLDIYVDGDFAGCASSDENFASNPEGLTLEAPAFQGIVDEFRLWTVSRLDNDLLDTCKDTELGFNSGDCGRDTDSLIAYLRFNEGSGSTVTDFSGLGSGSGEYADPDNAGEFLHWSTGWSTDIPVLTAAD